jgi:hypothetical protein
MHGLDAVGYPTFREGSLAQMDLTMKLSVDTGGDLVLECLNDNSYGDAPIEIVNFTKREP